MNGGEAAATRCAFKETATSILHQAASPATAMSRTASAYRCHPAAP